MKHSALALSLATLFLMAGCATQTPSSKHSNLSTTTVSQPVVSTQYGRIQGQVVNGVYAFKVYLMQQPNALASLFPQCHGKG